MELGVTFTNDPQSSASVLKEDCVEIVHQTASNANVDDGKCGAVAIQNFSCDSYSAAEIAAQLGQITEMPYQLRAASLELNERIKNSFQVYGYNCTRSALTVTVKPGAALDSLEQIITSGQT